jgi:hypothetical protein
LNKGSPFSSRTLPWIGLVWEIKIDEKKSINKRYFIE